MFGLTCSLSILGYIATYTDELIPVWLMSTVEVGGLGFGTTRTGFVNGITGVCVMTTLFLVYNPIASKLGMIWSYRIGLILFLAALWAYPLLNVVADAHPAILWICIFLVAALRSVSGQFAFSSVMVLITNSAAPREMGAVHGIGQSFVAFLRAIAPAASGILYAWSVGTGLAFPINYYFSFVAGSFVCLALIIWSFFLPASLDDPYEETEEIEESKEILAQEL